MTNTGKQLEQLVMEVEGLLVPQGFKVESRKRIFDEEHQQIAEFDIIISGKIGSSPVQILIECRDRPSDGPAPGSWIEQLVGRRARFKFAKVVAVSTTGFATNAKEYAAQADIELRLLTELNSELITHWFRALVVIRHATPVHTQIIQARYSDQNEIQRKLKSAIADVSIETPILIIGAEKNSEPTLSVLDIWASVVDHSPQVFEGLELNGQTRRSTIVVMLEKYGEHEPPQVGKLELNNEGTSDLMFAGFDNPGIGYYVKAESDLIRIMAIVFQGKFRITSEIKPASKVYEYSTSEEMIATTIYFDLGDDEVRFMLSPQES